MGTTFQHLVGHKFPFQLYQPDDVDRTLGEVKATTCLLDPCISWLRKPAREGLAKSVQGVVNASLQQSSIPACLMEGSYKTITGKSPTWIPQHWITNSHFLIFYSWAKC